MDTPGGPIELARIGTAGVIRFARPERKNPLSVETLEALKEALKGLQEAEDIARIVITGSGDTFAAGANIKEVAALDPESARPFGKRGQDLMLSIYRSGKPVLAAIDGYCFGGALDLATACRFRIASPRSVFSHPGPKLGIMTGWGGTQLLPKLIGEKRALGMLLTGRTVNAEEALKIGLVDSVAEDPFELALRFEKR